VPIRPTPFRKQGGPGVQGIRDGFRVQDFWLGLGSPKGADALSWVTVSWVLSRSQFVCGRVCVFAGGRVRVRMYTHGRQSQPPLPSRPVFLAPPRRARDPPRRSYDAPRRGIAQTSRGGGGGFHAREPGAHGRLRSGGERLGG